MPRTSFEKELGKLRENVKEMAKRVEENYESLFEAYQKGAGEDVEKMGRPDKEIAGKQREIESQCLFLITRQQPVAGDLRVITASLKAVTDMERAGDHVSDMAELLCRIGLRDPDLYSPHLLPMIKAAGEMLRLSAEAFVNRDVEAAGEVIKSDDAVDGLFNKIKYDIIEALQKGTKDADECVDILMLAKYLEKIGDHAVNIGEWGIFQVTGSISNVRLF